jgi:hypothetical protein
MSRPRKGVTLENMYYVEEYFYRALKDDRLYEDDEDSWNLQDSANRAFKRLPSIDYKNEKTRKASGEERRIALQKWIDKYISSERWQRCLMTLRQNKSRKKLKHVRVDLPLEVFTAVKLLAREKKVTLSEAIYSAIKPALDDIYANEL